MSGESREGLVPSWWRNQTFPLSPEEQDLEYFRANLRRGLRLGHPTKKLEKQIELLEDAIVIYREQRPAMRNLSWTSDEIEKNEIMVLVEKFGFTEEEAESLLKHNKYIMKIPVSFLVQTFMRKLQNGLDRRRP